ncbi:TetR/AcrR family transcriptional regulator [Microbacterium sp. SS28]|uniref:TetR/AcrR family transcriptional regulator n=1 Tax=Microbacterium sp. SS28 TaxID=2919948 RepID=UPI001FA983E0|nr:TetR/AcrR family transcriptional regulator [Microbacterium sp. SS28]
MSTTSPAPLGRRERNKQQKLERIVAAAGELFAERGVDDVTTQEIADRADIGTGTLFLYAKTKGELLLLVQNSLYSEALARGEAAAEGTEGVLDGLLAVARPIVECNRVQVDNGRTYLREMVFGDPAEPHHAVALAIVAETEAVLAAVLRRDSRIDERDASKIARVISAVMFLSMAGSADAGVTSLDVLAEIESQLRAILPR